MIAVVMDAVRTFHALVMMDGWVMIVPLRLVRTTAQMLVSVTTGHATARPVTRGSIVLEGHAPMTAVVMVTVLDLIAFVRWVGQVLTVH